MAIVKSVWESLCMASLAAPTPGRTTCDALDMSSLLLVTLYSSPNLSMAKVSEDKLAPPQSTMATFFFTVHNTPLLEGTVSPEILIASPSTRPMTLKHASII